MDTLQSINSKNLPDKWVTLNRPTRVTSDVGEQSVLKYLFAIKTNFLKLLEESLGILSNRGSAQIHSILRELIFQGTLFQFFL